MEKVISCELIFYIMKYTVKYQAKNVTGVDFVFTETFNAHNKYKGVDAYVWKSEILSDIKKAHPDLEEFVILDCDTRVWSDSDDDSSLK